MRGHVNKGGVDFFFFLGGGGGGQEELTSLNTILLVQKDPG